MLNDVEYTTFIKMFVTQMSNYLFVISFQLTFYKTLRYRLTRALGFELFVFILRIMAITLKNGRLKMTILIQSEKNFLILRLWDFLCIREDSQIDFATRNVFLHVWGGGGGFYTRTFLKLEQ